MERISIATARNKVFAVRPYLFLTEIITGLVNSIAENFSLSGGTTEELIITITEKIEEKTFSACDLEGKRQELTLKEWETYFIDALNPKDLNDSDVVPLTQKMSQMNTQSLINFWLIASFSETLKIISNRLFLKIFTLLFDYKTIIEEDIKRSAFTSDDEAAGSNEIAQAFLALEEKAMTTTVKIIALIEEDLKIDIANEPVEELLPTGEKQVSYRSDHSMIFRRWFETMFTNITEKSFNTLLSNSSMLEALLILIPEGILFKKMIYFQLTTHHKFINYDFINARGRLEYIMDASDIYKNVLMNYLYNMMITENLIVYDKREKTTFERNLNNQFMCTLEGSILRPDSDKSFKRYKIQQLSDRLNKVYKYPGGVSSIIQYTSEEKYKNDLPSSLDEFGGAEEIKKMISRDEESQEDVLKTTFPITLKYLKESEKKAKEKKETSRKDDDDEVIYDK